MLATDTNLLLDTALNYAAVYGFAVFPCHSIDANSQCTCGNTGCKSAGKHPRTANGCLDATILPDQIEAWWEQWPDANIGIATGDVSNLVVVDVDVVKGGESKELLIDGLDPVIFSTPKVKTGAGLHFYYRVPAGAAIKNSASRLGKSIDVRGDGGYVIAPPSKHKSGKEYEFLNAHLDILEFPAEWLNKLNQPIINSNSPNGNGSSNGSSSFVVLPSYPSVIVPEKIDQGARNNELTRLAGVMRRSGFSEDAIFSALSSENQRICKPPLDDKELHQIARSIGSRAPHDVLNNVVDGVGTVGVDIENTLQASYYKDFKNQSFLPKEILAFHIGKGDVAMLSGATNAGKSTLFRNVLMCMAAGKAFMPFYDGQRPVKTIYFDLETDAEDLHRDTSIMDQVFTKAEIALLGDNLIVVPKGLLNGDLFQFNTHEDWINFVIKENGCEFVIVDNVSAAFDLRDENSGSEVTKKVMKPLGKLAMQGHCGVAFCHHFGKAKMELTDDVGVHAGRGSSSFGNLSRTVFNMFGNVSKGELVTVECSKRKTDGGQSYREVFRLEADRWFHATKIVATPKKKDCLEEVVDLMQTAKYRGFTASEILNALLPRYGRATIFRKLSEGRRLKMIELVKGKYYLAGEDDDDQP